MGEEFVWACKNGDLDQVRAIAEKPGFDVNAEILNGRNGVHFAADYGHSNIIEYLLSKGADINGADKTLKAPDGSSYIECAETDEIKSLLK